MFLTVDLQVSILETNNLALNCASNLDSILQWPFKVYITIAHL